MNTNLIFTNLWTGFPEYKQYFIEGIDIFASRYTHPVPTDWESYEPLHVAAFLGNKTLCEQLIEQKVNPNGYTKEKSHHFAPVILATVHRHYDVIKYLYFLSSIKVQHTTLKILFNIDYPRFFDLFQKTSLRNVTKFLVHLARKRNDSAGPFISQLPLKEQFGFLVYCDREEDFIHSFNNLDETNSLVNIEKRLTSQNENELLLFAIDCKCIKISMHLFNRRSSADQGRALVRVVKIKEEKNFHLFWQNATSEVKNYKDKKKRSLLEWAIHARSSVIMKQLLDDCQFNTKTYNLKGLTPLNSFFVIKDNNEIKDLRSQFIERDENFTEDLMQCRLFGHRFDLKGKFFEGIYQDDFSLARFTYSLVNSLSWLDLIEFNSLHPEFNHTMVKELLLTSCKSYKDQSHLPFILCRAGWKGDPGHATYLVIYKEKSLCVKIDTGTGEVPGIHFFHMENITNLEGTLDTLQTVSKTPEGKEFWSTQLDAELKLTLILQYPWPQIGGHCEWVSAKATILTLFTLQKLSLGYDSNIYKSLLSSLGAALQPFWDWENIDSIGTFENIFPLLEKYPQIFQVEEILDELILNLFEREGNYQIFYKILTARPELKNWLDKKTGCSLIYLARQKENIGLLVYLIKIRCDLDVCSNDGISIFSGFINQPLSDEKRRAARNFALQLELSPEQMKILEVII